MSISGFGYLIKEGLKNVWNNRMMSIASIGILVSCLLLTGAAALMSVNVQQTVKAVGESNVFTVYLKQNVTELQAVQVGENLKNIDNISSCKFLSRDEAIKQYKKDLPEEIYQELIGQGNPLPNAFKISMADLSKYSDTVTKIKKVSGVDQISNKSDLAATLTKLNNLVSTAGIWIIIILGLISLFIISNTIRMTMYSRRFEISIMKSVGATNLFVRIPFIVEGMVIGLISGLISTLGLMFVYNILMSSISNLIHYDAIPFSQMSTGVLVAFIISGIAIGALGGIISVGKYLKKEGNEILGW
ncbi:MAG: permease-like cell division protein FtsX [Bacillota bacterium]|nr:permease-like cell division protein FtsX [Bacillota bacterium]